MEGSDVADEAEGVDGEEEEEVSPRSPGVPERSDSKESRRPFLRCRGPPVLMDSDGVAARRRKRRWKNPGAGAGVREALYRSNSDFCCTSCEDNDMTALGFVRLETGVLTVLSGEGM